MAKEYDSGVRLKELQTKRASAFLYMPMSFAGRRGCERGDGCFLYWSDVSR